MTIDRELIERLRAIASSDTPPNALRALDRFRSTLGDDADVLRPLLETLVERCVELNRLRHLAGTDPLTQIANRRTFEAALDREVSRHNRNASGLAVVMFDLDGLKEINDQLGHAAGDEALVTAAKVTQDRLRGSDLLARLGGDEFAILLPMADRTTAELVAHRVRAAIEASQVRGRALRVSIGVGCTPKSAMTAAALLGQADAELYQEKSERVSRHSGLFAA